MIGLGTGRCGTASLARLLGSAAECHATHEMDRIMTHMSWDFTPFGIERALDLLESREAAVACDIAFYYLPCVEYIAAARPDATFVCMRRGREETVESYMAKTPGRDHWRHGGGRPDPWDRMYPKFDLGSKREAIGAYWDMYYERTASLESSGVRIRTFDVADLNDEDGARSIMEFAGLDPSAAPVGLRENAREA